jgi:hypothetical protein
VRGSDSWLFDLVQFDDSWKWKPRWRWRRWISVEFFMYTGATRIDEVGYAYEWDLNGVSNNSSASVVSGVVPIGRGTSPLTHKIMHSKGELFILLHIHIGHRPPMWQGK